MWFTYSYKSILQYFFDTHFGLDRKINGNLQSFLRARCGFKKGWGGMPDAHPLENWEKTLPGTKNWVVTRDKGHLTASLT